MTFLFAGLLGYATQPETDGFELHANDRPVLKFDVSGPTEWTSADGKSTLTFHVKKTVGPDCFGLFTLTVPRTTLGSRNSLKLEVRSLGEGSRRYFGLNPFRDLKDDF